MCNLPVATQVWDGPDLTNRDIRKILFNTIPYTRMLSGAYVASYISGVSVEHLCESDDVPKVITSIMRYHVYYTTRKFTVNQDQLTKANYNLSPVKDHIPNKTSYLIYGEKMVTGVGQLSDCDLSFIEEKRSGFAKEGLKLIQASIESYVYAVLGAQAKTRWSIVGKGSMS